MATFDYLWAIEIAKNIAWESSPVPEIILDSDNAVIAANKAARVSKEIRPGMIVDPSSLSGRRRAVPMKNKTQFYVLTFQP